MRLGILGLGNIGGAFSRLFKGRHELMLFDRHAEKANTLAGECMAQVAPDIATLVRESEYLILAVKPHHLASVAKVVASHAKKGQVIISVAAGFSTEQLKKLLPKLQVVRLMPNMALTVSQGVMAVEDDPELDLGVRSAVCELLQAAGWVVWLPAAGMEAVGALSGAGLAYLLIALEALSDAGIALGLHPKQALAIATQTMLGAATWVQQSCEGISELRWRISSPGGTTIEGIRALERGGMRSALIEAVIAAHRRACDLQLPQ